MGVALTISHRFSMNKFLQRFLRLVTIYAKFEIVGGLLLAMLIAGTVILERDRNNLAPSTPVTSSPTELSR